ncbi:glycerate kinase [Candidatus Hydrogenedentota bacterium]
MNNRPRIIVAPDSYKECASALEVATAMAMGIRRIFPEAEIDLAPMADGGEGTVEALIAATQGAIVRTEVYDPLGRPVEALLGISRDKTTAFIEMAAASGLALLAQEERDPRITTTYGTGQLIIHALDREISQIIVGIGGSATNDGGAGMGQALGYSLRDSHGKELPSGGAALRNLVTIDAADRHPRIGKCKIRVACDVTNTLCGAEGASHIYGPQKGADESAVRELDAALLHFGEKIEKQLGVSILAIPGGGAAGGLGAGLVAFAQAKLCNGVELVAEACGLAERIKGTDLVLTGEGRLDASSANGKTPVGVARIARSLGVPVIVIAGTLGEGYTECFESGITAAFSVKPESMPLPDAMRNVEALLIAATELALRS